MPLPLQPDVKIELSHQKTATHGVVTGHKSTNAGLPRTTFLNFLVGEAWEIVLQTLYE